MDTGFLTHEEMLQEIKTAAIFLRARAAASGDVGLRFQAEALEQALEGTFTQGALTNDLARVWLGAARFLVAKALG